jgi:ABC-type sulfate transport system substrate-binding protein
MTVLDLILITTCEHNLDGDTSKVIQLADVSFSSENKKIHEVNVCFKQFKHNTKGIHKTITFSHGEASVSAVTVLVNYLGIRQSSQGPLFLFQDVHYQGDRINTFVIYQ